MFVGLTHLVTSALVVAGCWSILREDVARLSLPGGTGINIAGPVCPGAASRAGAARLGYGDMSRRPAGAGWLRPGRAWVW